MTKRSVAEALHELIGVVEGQQRVLIWLSDIVKMGKVPPREEILEVQGSIAAISMQLQVLLETVISESNPSGGVQ